MEAIRKAEDLVLRPIEQVAMYAPEDPGRLVSSLKILGATEWTHDRVRARGTVFGAQAENVATLAFNYQLGPFEFEVLHYVSGDHWLRHRAPVTGPVLSHLGYHVENADDEMEAIAHRGVPISVAQDVMTTEHENPALIDMGRTYRYVVLNTHRSIGFDLKLIQRLEGGVPG